MPEIPLPVMPTRTDDAANLTPIGIFPLAPSQETLWLEEQLNPGSAYNMPEAWRLTGPLNKEALIRALNDLVQRHETLRTTIKTEGGTPVQVIYENIPFKLEEHDLREGGETAAGATMLRKAQEPFDLKDGPLVRGDLLQTADHDHVLLINMHHIISDAWSQAVLVRDLAALYSQRVLGNPCNLPELPIQYADFAVWQRESAAGDALARNLAYWKEQLKGTLPTCSPPPDYLRASSRTRPGATDFALIDHELVERLEELSRNHRVTLFMTLLAGFKTLLHRYTGLDDLVVGCPMAGRDRTETEPLIGMFVNTHAFRTNLEGNPTFADLLDRVRRVSLDAYAHQDISLDLVVNALRPERVAHLHPLFQIVFGLQTEPPETVRFHNLTAKRVELGNAAAKFDWTLLLTRTPEGLSVRSEYDTTLYKPETIARLVRHFRVLLTEIAKAPDKPISEYTWITPDERRLTLVEWNNTAADYERDATIHEVFEMQAKAYPNRPALSLEGNQITYAQLDGRAEELASALKSRGVSPGARIALNIKRSPELIIAILGILRASGTYVPLDPTYPQERVDLILKDCAADLLIREENGELLVLDLKTPGRSVKSVARTSTAYIMYTSGSTGTPKGVAVPHRAVLRLVRNTNYIRINPDSVFLLFSSPSFDASTLEIWGPLLNGARLAIQPAGMPSLAELGRTIRRERVDTLWLTAGLFNQMVDHELCSLAGVKQLLAGGEALSVVHVQKALAGLPQTTLINGYGPTENTTFSCCHQLRPTTRTDASNARVGATVPIGRPIANTQVYILDPQLGPCPIGVPGEIFVGGDGLALEYIGQPELTARKFITHALAPGTAPVRLYRTGDTGRWLHGGVIEFLGRRDQQIKIRGYRVEPGEIETTLKEHPSVRDAVLNVTGSDLNRQLVAYVVPASENGVDAAGLREHLRLKLPSYSVPTFIVPLSGLPLTTNGKIDRAALPPPPQECPREHLAPRTPQEELVSGIWKEVLRQDNIDIRQNFFHLGGHSLMATQMASRLAQVAGVDVPVSAIFENPTIESLAAALRTGTPTTPAPEDSITRLETTRARELLSRIEELSDEEVEKLLREI
jgi:amino acid adenylation domain-containing protein